MRKESGLITLFTCAAGAIGLFIRWLQLSSAFEPATGLPIHNAPASIAMAAAMIVYAVALIIVIRTMKDTEKQLDYQSALRGHNILYPAAAAILGIATIVSGLLMFPGTAAELRPALWRLLASVALLCGCAYPVLALPPKRSGKDVLTCLAALVPTIFFCIWLIVSYMSNAENPIVWAYATETLAISGATLGFYYCAGYAFGRPRPLSTAYFSHLGAFLCIVTLADTRSMPAQIMLGSAAVMLLMLSTTLIGNFEKAKPIPLAE